MPDAARDSGVVAAYCDFGYREVDFGERPNASASAAVPGVKATVNGQMSYYRRGQPTQFIAGAKVVLVSDRHCPVTAEQTTDAEGRYGFRDAVPGPKYQLYVLPPAGWKVRGENPISIYVSGPADRPIMVSIHAEPGDAPLPVVPANPAACTAGAPTARSR
ncbi:hypothetical protein [Amycolatopsis sp. MtRt-6]|uniref:hypothetical protein n=1 Tax=Amycolatopsis sp. MtRt-6 TaxID=2792782 RepID=UPI001F5D3CA7|nr:hypothetical protein [Amycolatopsis sp. MtRt-6]